MNKKLASLVTSTIYKNVVKYFVTIALIVLIYTNLFVWAF